MTPRKKKQTGGSRSTLRPVLGLGWARPGWWPVWPGRCRFEGYDETAARRFPPASPHRCFRVLCSRYLLFSKAKAVPRNRRADVHSLIRVSVCSPSMLVGGARCCRRDFVPLRLGVRGGVGVAKATTTPTNNGSRPCPRPSDALLRRLWRGSASYAFESVRRAHLSSLGGDGDAGVLRQGCSDG